MRNLLLFFLLMTLLLAGCAPAEAENTPDVPDTAPEAQATVPAAAEDMSVETAEEPPAAEDMATAAVPTVVEETPAAAESPARQVITRAITSEPAGLDPQGAPGSGQNIILPYLFDTLVYRNADNTYEPYLAEAWETSPDGRQITFTLRENVRFHDGTPLDAAAVKFTFERIQEQGQRSPLASLVETLASIEALDPRTVRFIFSEPSSTFLSSISTSYAGILSPSAVEAQGETFAQQPVGSGPYLLETWEPGVAITLVKNPDYAWAPPVVENQGPPHVDRLVFKIIPDVSQQLAAYEGGEVDILFVNQPNHVARLQQDPNTDLREMTLNSLIYLSFHTQKPPFDDVKVRQALAHAVNKDELVEIALGGVGEIAFAPLAPTLPGFDPALKEHELGYDPERAKALLEEAGFTQSGDGGWTREGEPLQAVLLTSTRPPNQALATVLQSQFKAIGVPVEIQQLDSTAAQEAATAGEYDLLLWRYDWSDADVLRVYLSSARIGRTNRNFYSNLRVDELLEQAAHELDGAARDALYLEAQQILLQEAPWQPLYVAKDYVAIRKEVGGVVMGAMGRLMLNDAVRNP
jgi:peptide/nickel transport system substrate-binding protein